MKNIGIANLFLILIISAHQNIFAQDIQFSQFYSAATYLNPAFAGSSNADRVIFHQRLQWPSLDAKYTTSLLSYDRYFEKYKSGFGLLVLKDFQGAKTINSSEFYLQYSYDITFSSKLAFRPGLQVGYLNRAIDYSHLLYPDQFNNDGLNGNSSSDQNFNRDKKGFADISTGGILYSKYFWISYAGHHLNTPNQSWRDHSSVLPVKHSFTTGYKIVIMKGEVKHHMGHAEDKFYIIPTFQYKLQKKSDQFDAGIYIIYNQLLTGAWYRGIPTKKYNDKLQNNESVVGLVGWRIKDLRITYSYDFTVSKLHTAKTGGSHELNLTYIFRENKKIKPRKILPCPNF